MESDLLIIESKKDQIIYWNPSTETWKETIPKTNPLNKKKIRILSFNILADTIFPANKWPYTLLLRKRKRYQATLDLFNEQDLDIICLNEVSPTFVEMATKHEIRTKYWFADLIIDPKKGFGNLIMSRIDGEVHFHLIKGLDRLAVSLKIETLNGRYLTIGNIHTTAYGKNIDIRKQQIEEFISYLNVDVDQDSLIIVGDLNLHHPIEDETLRQCGLIDIWKEIQFNENGIVPGYTYDALNNILIRNLFFGFENRRMRLDRITTNVGSYWHPIDIQLTGNLPINPQGTLFPSDHFGLIAELEENNSIYQAIHQDLPTKAVTKESRTRLFLLIGIVVVVILVIIIGVILKH